MPHGLRDLSDALGWLTEKAEQPTASRNRPISLYATAYDSITADASDVTVTASSGPWVWYNGSTGPPRLYWGLGQWNAP